jgi:ubiquinone biosynthesis O-methyltransferase
MITAMEVIEHVNNPNEFLKEINSLMKKNGILFLSTINKNFLAYLTTITIGENILGIIPKGTHDWEKYLTLEQMENYLNENGFKLIDVKGCFYNILTEKMSLINNTSVNYILTAVKI